jgi:putative heme-binding domain-containing protein
MPSSLSLLIARVADHYARGGPVDTVGDLLTTLANARPAVTEALLDGLQRGWQDGKVPTLTPAAQKAMVELMPTLAPASRGRLVTLALSWGGKGLEGYAAEVATSFLAQVRNANEAVADRVTAAQQLIDFRKAQIEPVRDLIALITPEATPQLVNGLLEAVGRSEAAQAPATIVELLPSLTPAVRPTALRVLLGRTDGVAALLGAIEQRIVQLSDLTLDQRQSLTVIPNQDLAARARRILASGGAMPDPDREKVVNQLMSLTQRTGNAEAGKKVFKDQCSKCHSHSGEGAHVGPDLTGMAVHPKAHLLTEIMDPSRSVEGTYRQYTVVTKAGKVITGLLASETQTAVEMIDSDAKKQSILKQDIERQETTNKSLMPEGFEKQIPEGDIVNLLEFLTQRGKYLTLPLDRAATVVTSRGMFGSPDNTTERLIFTDQQWGMKTFDGIPFLVLDPQDGRVPNAVLLYGPQSTNSAKMPKSVKVPCNVPAKAIHMLSGISGWGAPYNSDRTVSVIVRLHYDDGKTEDHELKNGVHFADYIGRNEVPESRYAFNMSGRQLRYLAVKPARQDAIIREIELVKGPDNTAPIVMAMTVEPADAAK